MFINNSIIRKKMGKLKISPQRIQEYENIRDRERKEERVERFVKAHQNKFCCLFFVCFPCIFYSKYDKNNQVSSV